MFFEDEDPVAPRRSDDDRFASATCRRALGELPALLDSAAPPLDTVIQSLESLLKAQRPREALVLRALRRTLECAVRDNDAVFPRVCGPLHRLATSLPAESRAGDVAAGLLLLFAHGLGEALESGPSPPGALESAAPAAAATAAPAPAPAPTTHTAGRPLVVMLGFAGGTPADLRKYGARLGYGGAEGEEDADIYMCASEVPEAFERNLGVVLAAVRASARPWAVHLFSKAGFLSLARLLKRLDISRLREERADGVPSTPLPSAIVWDSSPGSLINYDEFIAGTWAAAEVLARRAHFTYSAEARARMDALLRAPAYAPAVRDSYAPMHGLVIQPCVGGTCGGGIVLTLPATMPEGCHHLFLYSERDPVCSPDEIRAYVSALSAASGAAAAARGSAADAGGVAGTCRSVKVGGTHCDGLFWTGDVYIAAVRTLLASCS
jgi:hypothetical protein